MPFTIPNKDVAADKNQSIWMETDVAILVAGLNGVGVVSGCAVTAQSTPDMTLAVAAGTVRIASGAIVTVTAGNVTIGTADSTNPRVDLVSSTDAGVKTVTPGTAAALPKAPSLPSGNVGLAMVYVAAAVTTITSGRVTDKRVIVVAPVVYENFLTANVTTTSANTFIDGPSLSLPAGTYLFDGVVTCQATSAREFIGKLWDGTTLYGASPGAYCSTNGGYVALPFHGYAVLTTTTTVKASVASDGTATSTLLATISPGVTNKASYLRAVKIA